MSKPFHFKLRNGLSATLRCSPCPEIKAHMKAAASVKDFYVHVAWCMVEVEVENEILSLFYDIDDITPSDLVIALDEKMEICLRLNSFIIYKGIAYAPKTHTNLTLVNAILTGIKPGLVALVT